MARHLRALSHLAPYEIIVVDGGSGDRSGEICRQFDVKLISSERGRARQMNHGARQASGEVLLFLHADTRLPQSAFADIAAALRDPRYLGGRFDVDLEGRHRMLKIISALINYRSRATKVGTGDQALFVRRAVFERMGGFPEISLMEDVAFCRQLKRMGDIACLRSRVITSARRWESRRHLAHDFPDVDAQVTLSRRRLAGALETFLCRHALTLWPSWLKRRFPAR